MLARTLGYASPRKMLGEMLPSELADWLAEYAISPWGEGRADFRAALGTKILADVNRDREKHPEAFKVTDFMWDHLTAPQVEEDKSKSLSARLKATLLSFGKRKK